MKTSKLECYPEWLHISNTADGFGAWDSRNCRVIYETAEEVECGCDHLTHFAILLVSYVVAVRWLEWCIDCYVAHETRVMGLWLAGLHGWWIATLRLSSLYRVFADYIIPEWLTSRKSPQWKILDSVKFWQQSAAKMLGESRRFG